MENSQRSVTVEHLLALPNDELTSVLATVSFEQGLSLLEQLVQRVESGQLPLELAVTSYEKGVAVVAQLRALLAHAEQRVKVVTVAEGGTAV